MLICLSRAFSLTAPPNAKWKVDEMIPSMTKDARTTVFKGAEEIVKQAFARQPSYDDLVPALLNLGIEKLATECTMRVGVPIKPMLGNITKDLNDMSKILEGRAFACEFKYPSHSHNPFPRAKVLTIGTMAKEPKSTSPQLAKSQSSPATSNS